jgi:hypothetical protein
MITGPNQELLQKINTIRETGRFQTLREKIGEKTLKEFIAAIYPKYSLPEIEKLTGIPDSTLAYWFKRLGIATSRRHFVNVSEPGNFDGELVVNNAKAAKKISVINITPELAYIIGFALGDGSIQRFMVEVFNKDQKLRECLLKYLKQYGTVTEEEKPNGFWRLRLSNVKIANLIKNEKGIRQDTLDYIFNYDDLARKFIAAFWDAEGTVRKQGTYCHLYLYNSNNTILDKVRKFLASKNISYSDFSHIDVNRIYFLGGRQVHARKVVHRISIPKSSNEAWIKEIGIHLMHGNKCVVVGELLKKKFKEE